MKESVLLAFGLLAFLASWQFIFRKTILDTFRDRLFTLRSRVRKHFMAQPAGLERMEYRELRDLLNHQIRFLEDSSLIRMAFLQHAVRRDKELRDELIADYEERFRATDPATRQFMQAVREEAYFWVSGYLIHASLITAFALYARVAVYLLATVSDALWRRVALHQHLITYAMQVIIREIAAKLLNQRAVESAALRLTPSPSSAACPA